MAEYVAKGSVHRAHGNTLRGISSPEPTSLSTASLCLGGSYHIDTLVRPVSRERSDNDPQLVSQTGQVNPETKNDTLVLPGVRTPNPQGWQSPEAPLGED